MQRGRQRSIWIQWLLVTVVGAVVGALIAWQVRSFPSPATASLVELLRYVATIANAAVLSGAQWVFLRRYRLEVYWWVPATVTASLIDAIIVVPSVLRMFVPSVPIAPMSTTLALIAGAAALAAGGLVVGVAQALVLRASGGRVAWAWVPATVVAGALSGALTTAISEQLSGLPTAGTIGVVAAVPGLLMAASQAPVLLRIVR